MLSGKRLDLICLVVVLLAAGACGLWAFRAVAAERARIEEKRRVLDDLNRDLEQTRSELRGVKTSVAETRQRLDLLNDRIPATAEMGEFLKRLDRMLNLRDATLISVKPLSQVDEKLYARIPLRLVFRGEFEQVYRLLHDLESMERVMVMERLTVIRPQGTEACQVDVTASLFSRL